MFLSQMDSAQSSQVLAVLLPIRHCLVISSHGLPRKLACHSHSLPGLTLGRGSPHMLPMKSSATSPEAQKEVCYAVLDPRLRFPMDRLISALNHCGQEGTMGSAVSQGPDRRIHPLIPCRAAQASWRGIYILNKPLEQKRVGENQIFFS